MFYSPTRSGSLRLREQLPRGFGQAPRRRERGYNSPGRTTCTEISSEFALSRPLNAWIREQRSGTVNQQNHYGGSVWGTLIKDKLFLLGTYDGSGVNPISYRQRISVATLQPSNNTWWRIIVPRAELV